MILYGSIYFKNTLTNDGFLYYIVCMKNYISILFLVLASSIIYSQGTQLLRQPSLSETHIVFVYANDLWQVERNGSIAQRLTTNEGYESNPHYSDDGKWIAFTAEYDGNVDIYILPSSGGSPQRVTHHPTQDFVEGWTPDGHILFRSGRQSHPTKTSSLFTIDPKGGMPQLFIESRSAYGKISSDGQWLAYTPFTEWDPEWRNYRGGQAVPIWIQNVKTGDLIRTPQKDKERHLDPLWMGKTVYYISERDYASNIWSYNVDSGEEQQITFHKKFDVKSIDAFGNDIIYEQGGYLHLLEDGKEAAKQLKIQVIGDMNFSRPRWVSVSAKDLQNPNVSPNGKRAIFEHRGEIISVPKKEGNARNVTNSSGVADRAPSWSPNGDQIAYFSDESGEYKLMVADQFGEILKSFSIPAGTFYYQPEWSPNGKKLAFTDTDYNLWSISMSTGVAKKIDTDGYAHPNRTFNAAWSPDSRYIAYAKQQDSHFKSVFIYDSSTASTQQITQGLADIISPVFDQSGKYIYYLASTDYGLASGWLDMSSYDPSTSRTLYATVLQNDGVSPILPKSDEEEKTNEESLSDEKKESDDIPSIDFDHIMKRTVAISKVSGNFTGLHRAPAGKVFVLKSEDASTSIHKFDFDTQELDEFSSGIAQFATSQDGENAVYRKGDSWYISSLSGMPDPDEDLLSMNIKLKVHPKEEYKQIFKESWRFMRDYLYVNNVHGAPWQQIWEWYSPWLDHVKHRTDLNYVVDILSGEVAIGHSFVRGGDMPDVDRVNIGLLGADYTIENNLYKISKIYTGEFWNPDITSPLSGPGIDIQEGDYITAVNGKTITGENNFYSFFEETVGKQIRLSVQSSPIGQEREVVVVPIRSENGLRTNAWMEANRKKVAELSNNKLAYVWVPNTGGGGFTNFNRYYFSQQDKKGVIIDERNNGGGSAADYMIDIMSRERFGYFNSKAGDKRPWTTPIAGIWGPKVMIINERAGSGGDLLPYMFKAAGLGPLVGTRTWGGLVGTWDTPLLIDGGRMVAPRGGFFDLDGKWAVEGEGISPDIEVIQDPKLINQGIDPQLEAAVEEAMRLLKNNEFEMKPEPAAPIRWKRPAGWESGN